MTTTLSQNTATQVNLILLAENPDYVTISLLDTLKPKVKQQLAQVLDRFEELSSKYTDNNTKFAQNLQEKGLALTHFTNDLMGYQKFTDQQQQLQKQIDDLTKYQSDLKTYFETREKERQASIDSTGSKILDTETDLSNFKLVDDPKTLIKDPNVIATQIKQQQDLLAIYQQQLANFSKSQTDNINSANYYANAGWKSGRKWFGHQYRYQDPEMVKMKNYHQNLADIYGNNAALVKELINEINQQITALNNYVTTIQKSNELFASGQTIEATQLLAAIQEQNNLYQAIEKNYFDQVALVENQRATNQNLAGFFNSQINQVVKSNGFGNKVMYQTQPEYIGLRDLAQNLANQANNSFKPFQDRFQTAQSESNSLSKLTQDLTTRLYQYFPKYKEGIQAEIAAYLIQWQNQQNLKFIETLTHQQQLDLLQFRIDQAKQDLTKLETESIPSQQQTLATSQKRFLDLESQGKTLLIKKENSDQKFLQFIDTNGFFLSDAEKLEITQNILEQNQRYLTNAQEIIEQLEEQLKGNPNAILEQQLSDYRSYVQNLEQQSNWATFQQANFNYLTPDAEDSSKITDLIKDLTSFDNDKIKSLSVNNAVNFLQNIQEDRSNLVTSLDELESRITDIEQEKKSVETVLKDLQAESEQSAKLEELEATKKAEKASLEKDILAQKEALNLTQKSINDTQALLTQNQSELDTLKASKITQEAAIQKLQSQISATQSQFDAIPNSIKVKQTEIQRQQQLLGLLDQNKSLLSQATSKEQQSSNYWNLSRKKGLYSPVTTQIKVGNRFITKTVTHIDTNWQQWDTLTKQATSLRQQIAQNQTVINQLTKSGSASQTQITNLQQEIVALQNQQTSLQNKLTEDNKQLTILKEDLTKLNQNITDFSTKIDSLQTNLTGYKQTLSTQEESLQGLETSLDQTNQILSEIPQNLGNNLTKIQLTQKYLDILDSELKRLSIPDNLFDNFAQSQDNFEQNYDDLETVTKLADESVKKLVEIRQQGEDSRSQLNSLQSQLKDLQTDLETQSKDNTQNETTANSLQKDLALIDLQLATQKLHLNGLNQQANPLLNAEAYFYQVANHHRVRIGEGHGNAYQIALEQASLMRQQYNNLLVEIATTDQKITDLTTQKTEKTNQLNQYQSGLVTSDTEIGKLKSKIEAILAQIEDINTNLAPLQQQEAAQIKTFFDAMTKAELLRANLEISTQEQFKLSQQLIQLGLVASESDVNFFEEEIQTRINQFKSELASRNQDFSGQLQDLTTLITDWEKLSTNNPDDVVTKAIKDLISSIQKQQQTLTDLQKENTANLATIETNLQEALTSLKPWREQQQLLQLQELVNNQKLDKALEIYTAIQEAINTTNNTNNLEVFADLNQVISQSLKDVVNQWTTDLQSGNLETQELSEIKQNFSKSFDTLVKEIQTKLADVQGDYELNTTQLEESLRIVDVLTDRQDILAESVDSTEDVIALITKQLAQAQELQEKIGHLANLYQLESAYKVSKQALKPENLNLQIQELSNKIKEISQSDVLGSQKSKDSLKYQHDLILQKDQALLNTLPSKALSFDGVNDSVRIAHNSKIDLVNEWTLEAWIWLDETGKNNPIIEKYNWQNGFGGFNLRVSDQNKLVANVINGITANAVISTQNINAKTWYHVSATFDKNQKTLKLYINGTLAGVNSNVTITPISSNVSLKIGERGDDLQPRYWYFDGKMDEVRVWNKARSQEEIQTNMYHQLQGNETGLAGYWNFEEGTGTTTKDLTSNGNNGTIYGSTWTTGFSEVAIPRQKDAITQLQALLAEKIKPLLIQELTQEINQLPARYELESEALQKYLDYRTKEILKTSTNQDETVKQLQVLRLEVAYIAVKFDKNSETVQKYLASYEQIQLDQTKALEEIAQDTPIINSNITAINYAINSYINYNLNQVRLTNIDGDRNLEALVFRPGSGRIFASEANEQEQMTTLFDSNTGLAGYNLLSGADRIVTFDYDGDKDTDIFLYRPGLGAAWVARSNGNNTFTAVYTVGDNGAAAPNGIAGFNFLSPSDIALSFDYNGDNQDDLFFYRPGRGASWVARSNGDGSFTAVYAQGDLGSGIAGYDMRSPADRVVAFDYDGDNKDDLFIYRPGRGASWVARSNGNGTFTAVYAVGDDGAAGANGIAGFDFLSPSDIALSFDYNGDGKDDLFLYRPGAGAAYVVKSNGNGTFTRVYGSGSGIAGFNFLSTSDRAFAYDYDADGDDDLFFYRQGVNNVWIARSNGDSTFTNLGRANANDIIQYQKNEITSKTKADIKALRDQLLPGFDQDVASKVVNGEIPDQLNKYLADLEDLKNSLTKQGAAATSALIQADWYAKEAAQHWQLSHKQGPTWSEFRRTYTRRWWGGKKWKTIEIKHVDHHWIIWDNYTKLAATLRYQAVKNITDNATRQTEQKNLEDLISQWKEAYKQSGIAEETWQQVYNTLQQLFANQDLVDDQQQQLELLQQLLPNLKDQLAQAQTEVNLANAQLAKEWTEYELSSAKYIDITEEIAPLIANLDRKAEEVYQQIDTAQRSLQQQKIALDVELQQTLVIKQTLEEKLAFIAEQLKVPLYSTEEISNLKSQQTLLQQALQLIDYKATILTAKQTNLSQQQELVNTQTKVLATEEDLLNAYLASPDDDWSNLTKQLENARNTLAEAQKLAEKAEASSQLLTIPFAQLTNALLQQNDQHLTAIKAQQTIVNDLIKVIEINKNYTLEAAQKKATLNDLEVQGLQRLQEIAEAGTKEAQKLLEVAKYNNFATAADVYYRDYHDLTTDQKSSSAGGLATAQDWILADHYYDEMVKYRQLEKEAKQQANSFTEAKEAATEQLTLINQEKTEANKILAQLNQSITNTQKEIDDKNQQLSIVQNRLDLLEQLQSRTQQTLSELINIEKFNVQMAQLEQQLAKALQSDLDETLAEQLERDYLQIQLQRQQATEKIQRLNQLQSLDDLETALNKLRSELGLESFEGLVTEAQKQAVLASLLTDLQTIQQQSNLPNEIKTLLTSTQTDIHAALQGEEAAKIQDNLLHTTGILFDEVNKYNAKIAELEAQTQKDYTLLQQAETNLQSASRQLYDQITLSDTFKGEKELLTQAQLTALYQVAYAQQGVKISDSLAAQSKQIISKIIDARIVEREARKKAFFNELFTVLGTALSIASTVFSLAVPAFIPATLGVKIFGGALTAMSGIVKAAQAAYNGDIIGAIYNGITAVVGFATSSIDAAIKSGYCEILGMSRDTAQTVVNKLQDFEKIFGGVYGGIKLFQSGDEIGAFLTIATSIASASLDDISNNHGLFQLSQKSVAYQLIKSFSDVSLNVYGGIKAIENEQFLTGIESIFNALMTTGTNLSNTLSDNDAKNVQKYLTSFQNLASGIFDGVGELQSGDKIGALLEVISGVSSASLVFIKEDKDSVIYQLINSLTNVPLKIHNGIQAIEDDSLFAGIQQIFQGLAILGQNFSYTLPNNIFPIVADIINKIHFAGNIGFSIGNAALNNNNIQGWLGALTEIYSSFKEYKAERNEILVEHAKNTINADPRFQALLHQQNLTNADIEKYLNHDFPVKIGLDPYNEKNGSLYSVAQINPNRETFVIVHGWNNSSESAQALTTAAIFKALHPNANIILVDWKDLAGTIYYPNAAQATAIVGENLAVKLHDLGINFQNTTIVGHSLGAHVAGVAGEYIQQNYNSELGKIVGLDPAAPLFDNKSLDLKLDATDAKTVEVIHSDYQGALSIGGTQIIALGAKEDMGTFDLYMTRQMNRYYDKWNGGGTDHQDAYGFFNDYLLSGASNPQQFFDTLNNSLNGTSSYSNLNSSQTNNNSATDTLTGLTQFNLMVGTNEADTFLVKSQNQLADNPNQTFTLISDFDSIKDQIQLSGSLDNYSLGVTPQGLPSGTGIYYNNSGQNQLVAIIEAKENLSLIMKEEVQF